MCLPSGPSAPPPPTVEEKEADGKRSSERSRNCKKSRC